MYRQTLPYYHLLRFFRTLTQHQMHRHIRTSSPGNVLDLCMVMRYCSIAKIQNTIEGLDILLFFQDLHVILAVFQVDYK